MFMADDPADRESFYVAAAQQAKREYQLDNTNVQALIRWGGALLESAHFQSGKESLASINEAIKLLQQAAELDSEKPEAEWCLGNAYTSLGFLQDQKFKATEYFTKAAGHFKSCSTKDPENPTYKKAMDMCEKAPDYYDEIQSHIQAQNMTEPGPASRQGGPAGGAGGAAAGAGSSDVWWDLAGWALLTAVVVGTLVYSRTGAKPSASA